MAEGRLRAADWAALIDEWRQGGLGLPASCERRGLRRGTIQIWVDKPSLKRALEEAQREAQVQETDPGHAAGPPVSPSPAFLAVRARGR
jgi:hypothetical protein